jgi:hypothetical protein
MGVYYGDKIYGVRWARLNTDIDSYEGSKTIFELKFQLLTTAHMNTIKDAFQKVEEQEQEPNNIIEYYFQRIMQTTHEWCSNSDEVVYFVWVKCTKEDMERFIQQNEKNIL